MTKELTIQPNKLSAISEAEANFISKREATFQNMADTARAGIRYGALVSELRLELGSEREFSKALTSLGAKLPIEETHKLMKVAARHANEGDSLFLNKSSAVWAQAEMGLLPPPAPATDRPEPKPALPVPADALKALSQVLAALDKVTEVVPLASWTKDERAEAERIATRILQVVTGHD